MSCAVFVVCHHQSSPLTFAVSIKTKEALGLDYGALQEPAFSKRFYPTGRRSKSKPELKEFAL